MNYDDSPAEYEANMEESSPNALLNEFYTRVYPTADELLMDIESFEESELADMVAELRTEVEALKEETEIFSYTVEGIKAETNANQNNNNNNHNNNSNLLNKSALTSTGIMDYSGNVNGSGNLEATPNRGASMGSEPSIGNDSPSAYGNGGSATLNNQRGQQYRRKSLGELDYYVSLEDKMDLLVRQEKLLSEYDTHNKKNQDDFKAVLIATVDEAKKRMNELKLEVQQFHREVLGGDEIAADGAPAVYAEELLRFLQQRIKKQAQYEDKLKGQIQIAEKNIVQAQAIEKQRQIAGESFHLIDLEQLNIENEQLMERFSKKNAEIAQLKNVSTRTVQTLNTLTNNLNTMTQEQLKLRKELKSRKDYLSKCSEEITQVEKEAGKAETMNKTIKAQHEAVHVPKIEEYIAQKAELFELEKTVKSWERKVDIAEGQAKVVRQQLRSLKQKEKDAMAYVAAKKKGKRGPAGGTAKGNPAMVGNRRTSYTQHQNTNTFSPNNGTSNSNTNLFLVGGSASPAASNSAARASPEMHSSPIPQSGGNSANNLDKSSSTVVGGTRSLLDAKRSVEGQQQSQN